MKNLFISSLFLLVAVAAAHGQQVNITRDIDQFQVRHGGRDVTIIRNQDTGATLDSAFALTSRPCPPFCAQPMQVSPEVETIGEVELSRFMQTRLADGSGAVIDARTEDWYRRGTIPGSINIPYTHLNPGLGADEFTLEDALAQLGVTEGEEGRDFSQAKHVVIWCNGPWCGQSPAAIRGMLSIGYPADKILYYRGGMQLWQVFGLPVISPDGTLSDK